MEPGHRSWAPPPAGGNTHANDSQAPAGFGPGTPQHQPHQSPPTSQSGPPPGAPFPAFHQTHSLANLAGLTQSAPRQHLRSEGPANQMPPAAGFSLPALSQATGQPSAAERERDRAREVEQQIHIKEEDRRHREQEQQRMDQAPPHQAQGPPIQLHQPIAVGPPARSVHGPNGILGNPGLAGQGAPSQLQLGAPSGPGNIFASGAVQQIQAPSGQPLQQGFLGPYGVQAHAPQQPQQPQQQMAQGQGQGQQPILNDALSYLDQVKVQFADHPDVYNRFLDIMKEFKSSNIDTPGVIGRVSTLFAGNPELIQGFNTFLPPGYRIDCGGEDPNAIRVTTPMGTTVQSITRPQPLGQQEGEDSLRPANDSYTPQPSMHSAQMMYSPSGRPIGPAAPGQQIHLSPLEAARQQEQQAIIHQQEQRGVNSLQSAVSVAAAGAALRTGASPRTTPMPPDNVGIAVDGGQLNPEKRGPVEFNHAISYVNKIKNRFASQPDIYKQFLEILQTYQRESKPIQDVYSQVTKLFNTAPDLLEDFKQFLPESAAQAKAAERERQRAEEGAMLSNVRGDGADAYGSPVMGRDANLGTPNHGRGGLPPVGNFAPTPASKDYKRKRGDRQGTAGSVPEGAAAASGAKTQFPGPPAKRSKQSNGIMKGPSDLPPVSPSLIPALPSPITPTATSAATHEEMSAFDKAKKHINNRNVYNEFIKMCNLFSQDLIERSTLAHRMNQFIGGNPELMKWFMNFLGVDDHDITVVNKPRIPGGRVGLSNCRGHGPSYRLLPKRERQKPCSGRDEMCNSVLNDEWASHPTWASEDSGFVAHRKNVHEEGLHRIEEERHDYDLNIEACNRTIQLLEPIAITLRGMDDNAMRSYILPPGLGGQSETIYQRVIMKLYGREQGHKVIESLHHRPFQVVPVLLNRLKERLESWKMAQREWEKVWREQTQKMFWRSLDHQAVLHRLNGQRQFQLKTLQTEIQTKYEEMKRESMIIPGTMRKPQMEVTVDDEGVIMDTTHLILRYVDAQLSTDQPRLYGFIRDFVPMFFGLDQQYFKETIDELIARSPNNESAEDQQSGSEDATSSKSRKGGAFKNHNLLRTALDPSKRRREESHASNSRASTPDVASNADDDMVVDGPDNDDDDQEVSTLRWLEHPLGGNMTHARDLNPTEPQKRDTYPLWANNTIYCFVRLFLILYERLYKLKMSEAAVRETVKNAAHDKPAIELSIVDKLPHDFFADTSETANYYGQMLQKFDDFLRQELDFGDIEETLRRFYMQSGYPLYGFEKIITTITRTASQIMDNGAKDKSADIYQMFKRDRSKDYITAQQQSDYKKAVDKMVKDQETYKIDYLSSSRKVQIFLARKDTPLMADGFTKLDREDMWRHYIASYTSVDRTDGISIGDVSLPFAIDNVRAFGADPENEAFPPIVDEIHQEAIARRFADVKNEERLNIRVGVDTFRAIFQPNTFETFHASPMERQVGEAAVEGAEETRAVRDAGMRNAFLTATAPAGLTAEELEAKDASFAASLDQGEIVGAEDEDMDMDA